MDKENYKKDRPSKLSPTGHRRIVNLIGIQATDYTNIIIQSPVCSPIVRIELKRNHFKAVVKAKSHCSRPDIGRGDWSLSYITQTGLLSIGRDVYSRI